MVGVIDSHIHIDTYCRSDREKIINSLEKNNIHGLISVSTNLTSLKKLIKFSNQHSSIKPCAGYHPEQELPSEKEIEELIDYIRTNHKFVYGIGEVGLPYYIRENETDFNKEPYIKHLEQFIVLAKELQKPLNIHAIYEDAKLVCELLEKHDYHEAHFHWAKTDIETLLLMKERGYLISITPDVLYKKRTRDLIKYYPQELLMVETDGPWKYEFFDNVMTHPKMVYDIIEEIALIKGASKASLERQILRNTKSFYKI